jgi:hypothetical protein
MGRSQEVTPKSFSCDGIDTWAQGNNLINFMKTVIYIINSGVDYKSFKKRCAILFLEKKKV